MSKGVVNIYKLPLVVDMKGIKASEVKLSVKATLTTNRDNKKNNQTKIILTNIS